MSDLKAGCSSVASVENADTLDTSGALSPLEATIQKAVDSVHEVGSVRLIDESTADHYVFKLVEGQGETLLLMDKRKKVVGMCSEWYDDSDTIPEEHKDQDGIVQHPETQEPLMEFRLHEFPYLCDGTYREYRYLEDHGNLQATHAVDLEWF